MSRPFLLMDPHFESRTCCPGNQGNKTHTTGLANTSFRIPHTISLPDDENGEPLSSPLQHRKGGPLTSRTCTRAGSHRSTPRRETILGCLSVCFSLFPRVCVCVWESSAQYFTHIGKARQERERKRKKRKDRSFATRQLPRAVRRHPMIYEAHAVFITLSSPAVLVQVMDSLSLLSLYR